MYSPPEVHLNFVLATVVYTTEFLLDCPGSKPADDNLFYWNTRHSNIHSSPGGGNVEYQKQYVYDISTVSPNISNKINNITGGSSNEKLFASAKTLAHTNSRRCHGLLE